jgi:hypothetical protein
MPNYDVAYRPLSFSDVKSVEEDMQHFLWLASSDVKTDEEPKYEKAIIVKNYEALKNFLKQPQHNSIDFISLIVNHHQGMNGWQASDTESDLTKYPYNGQIPSSEQNNYSLGVFSGKIAFRKELTLAAIEGGYLDNVNADNLFKGISPLPGLVKDIVENCPQEVLIKGHKNMYALIEEMERIQFLTPEQTRQWKEDFNLSTDTPGIAAPKTFAQTLREIFNIRDNHDNQSNKNKP